MGRNQVLRLRSQLRRVEEERDLLKKPRGTLPGNPSEVPLHERAPSSPRHYVDVPGSASCSRRVLRMAARGVRKRRSVRLGFVCQSRCSPRRGLSTGKGAVQTWRSSMSQNPACPRIRSFPKISPGVNHEWLGSGVFSKCPVDKLTSIL